MVRQVYDEPRVPRVTYVAATEPKVNWFLESTRPEAVKGRRVVNDLYSWFADGDDRMYADLRSRDDKRLLTALDELLVHDLLIRRYHVTYEEGDGTRPD